MIVADCVKSMKFQLNDNKKLYILSFTQPEKIEIRIPCSLVDILLTKPLKTSKQNFCRRQNIPPDIGGKTKSSDKA